MITLPIIFYTMSFYTMICKLKSTGAKMEELDIVVHSLTLSKSYDNLVTALETIDQEKLTLEFVKTRLMASTISEVVETIRANRMNSVS